MEITYLGHSCLKIRGKEVTLVTDPYCESVGYRWIRPTANIVTVSHSHEGHSNSAGVDGNPRVISRPGEYEIGGVFVMGVPNFHDSEQGKTRGKNISYVIEMEDMRLCHLGDLGHLPSARQAEELGNLDILIAPVGGQSTIDAKGAADIVRHLNPKVVIPMHYQSSVVTWLEPLDKFLTEMGLREVIPQPKFSVTKSNLNVGTVETKVIVLDYRLSPVT